MLSKRTSFICVGMIYNKQVSSTHYFNILQLEPESDLLALQKNWKIMIIQSCFKELKLYRYLRNKLIFVINSELRECIFQMRDIFNLIILIA